MYSEFGIRRLRMKEIEGGDVQSVIELIIEDGILVI